MQRKSLAQASREIVLDIVKKAGGSGVSARDLLSRLKARLKRKSFYTGDGSFAGVISGLHKSGQLIRAYVNGRWRWYDPIAYPREGIRLYVIDSLEQELLKLVESAEPGRGPLLTSVNVRLPLGYGEMEIMTALSRLISRGLVTCVQHRHGERARSYYRSTKPGSGEVDVLLHGLTVRDVDAIQIDGMKPIEVAPGEEVTLTFRRQAYPLPSDLQERLFDPPAFDTPDLQQAAALEDMGEGYGDR